MNHRLVVLVAAVVMSFSGSVGSAQAQTASPSATAGNPYPRTLEINFGPGYTAVDLETRTMSPLTDWNQMNWQGGALILPVRVGKISFGGEFGYQWFFSYTYSSGYSWDYYVERPALRFLGVVRVETGNGLFADAGAGLYRFLAGWTCFGFTGSVGYAIRVNDRVSIPIRGRIDYVIDDAGNIPAFGGLAGVLIRF